MNDLENANLLFLKKVLFESSPNKQWVKMYKFCMEFIKLVENYCKIRSKFKNSTGSLVYPYFW